LAGMRANHMGDLTQKSLWLKHFEELPDPRLDRKKRHMLMDILVLTLCAVICGATSWESIEDYGNKKKDWLKTFLVLPNGIPSHDTIARVFSLLDAKKFASCFIGWMKEVVGKLRDVVAIDGKRLCAASNGRNPIHMVNAFATAMGLSLGQYKVRDKSNEITAIPEILKLLSLEGCIVTIDAMGCQKEIAAQIIAAQADYVLALKGNQGGLYEDVQLYMDTLFNGGLKEINRECKETLEKGHGRIERRQYLVTDSIDWIEEKSKWEGLRSIGMVVSERTINGITSIEKRYYLNSLEAQVEIFSHAVRQHWGVENQLHWVLDVTFNEDRLRMNTKHSAQNLAVIRQSALNLLRMDQTTKKMSLKRKQFCAALDNEYLRSLIMRCKDLDQAAMAN
jgi:predicted transposase YbfD/YdcC